MTTLIGFLIVGALAILIPIVLPILSFVRASRALQQSEELKRQMASLGARLAELTAEVAALSRSAPSAGASVNREAVVSTDGELERVVPVAEEPERAAGLPPIPETLAPEPAIVAAGPDARTEVPPLPLPAHAARVESLESRIGSRWLLYVGVFAILVGASYFVKYAFDNEWVNPAARVSIGAAAGLLMIGAGFRFIARGYVLYGQMLSGGGIALLYVATYAAFNFYRLIDRPVAFAVMAVITAGAAMAAARQRAQGLALMAVGGGFLTPFLVGGDTDAQVALFTYDAILVAGTMSLARLGGWPALNLASFVLTVLTVGGWLASSYTSDRYLVTELFLTIFCGMFLVIRAGTLRSPHPMASRIARVLLLAPVLYYLVSLAILDDHPLAFLVYLVAVSLAGVMVAGRERASSVRLTLWAAVALPLGIWFDSGLQAWVVPAAVTAIAIYALHLVFHLDLVWREERPLDRAEIALVHANGLGLYALLYVIMELRYLAWAGPVAALAALWNLVLWRTLRRVEGQASLHFLALAFTLGAIAIGVQFDGPWVIVGWAAQGAALAWIGAREERPWLRTGGAVLLGLATAQLLAILSAPLPAGYRTVLNERTAAAAFVIGLLYALAALEHALEARRATRLEGEAGATIGPGEAVAPGGQADRPAPIRPAILVAANVLTLVALTAEINAYWSDPSGSLEIGTRTAYLAREMLLSIAWAAYAVGLIVVGIRRTLAAIRYLAIAVLGVTIVKVFAVDLAELDRIFRILSVVGLGLLLLVAAYLYQRFRDRLAAAGR